MKKAKTETKSQKQSVRERLANSLEASKEVLLDTAKITLIGNREVTVENYKSIVDYNEKQIVVETSPHRIKILGSQLEIISIAREMLFISGKVSRVEFKMEVQ